MSNSLSFFENFEYKNNQLHCENVAFSDLAQKFATPLFVYSRGVLENNFNEFNQVLKNHPAGNNALLCYAVKANGNLAILDLFSQLGAGFDIVSGGELARVMAAGGDASKVVFSGVGKSESDIRAALEANIHCFNVESEAELYRLNEIAKKHGKVAPISFRVNPNVDPKTHPYISTGLKKNKFGVAYDNALDLYKTAAKLEFIKIVGIDCHIGSQLLDVSPCVEAFEKILLLVEKINAAGINIAHIDIGGGLGIRYQRDEVAPKVADYLNPILDLLQKYNQKNGTKITLILEPGRRMVGNAGALLMNVEYTKLGETKNFVVVDAAMNDLMRPALYDAWHEILPVKIDSQAEEKIYDVVGPICETGDFIGKDRKFASQIQSGDLLAAMSAGAYGMSMSSNYNARVRVAEVLVSGDKVQLIRERETIQSLFANEKRLDH